MYECFIRDQEPAVVTLIRDFAVYEFVKEDRFYPEDGVKFSLVGPLVSYSSVLQTTMTRALQNATKLVGRLLLAYTNSLVTCASKNISS